MKKKIKKIIFFILNIIFFSTTLICLHANAATYYVAKNGNDNNPGTEAQPWLTINKAAATLVAGDTVYVKAGTYNVGSGTGDRTRPKLNPTNSGTSGNPIAFRRYATDRVILTQDGRGPLIGALNKSYIIWDGLEIHDYDGIWQPDTGSTVIWNSNYCTIENCILEGSNQSLLWDNYCAIRTEWASNCTIRNNYIYNFMYLLGSPNDHAWGYLDYGSNNIIVENNYFENCFRSIMFKDAHNDGSSSNKSHVRYNYFKNCRVGICTWGNTVPTRYGTYRRNIDIYQNIFDGTWDAYQPGDTAFPSMRFYNNTIYNTYTADGYGIINWGRDNTRVSAWNNIGYANGLRVNSQWYPDLGFDLDYWDYNCWYGGTGAPIFLGGRNFSTWNTYCDTAYVANCDDHSITLNPLFVSPGTDFHLQSGSPCINAGIDRQDYDKDGNTTERINMGCYITGSEIIGRTSGASTTTSIPQTTTTTPTGDTVSPTITITNPSSAFYDPPDEDVITISGTASDNVKVTSVTWSNNRGGSGNATVTTSGTSATWTINNSTMLKCGDHNIITIKASDAAGNEGIAQLTVDVKPCDPKDISY